MFGNITTGFSNFSKQIVPSDILKQYIVTIYEPYSYVIFILKYETLCFNITVSEIRKHVSPKIDATKTRIDIALP